VQRRNRCRRCAGSGTIRAPFCSQHRSAHALFSVPAPAPPPRAVRWLDATTRPSRSANRSATPPATTPRRNRACVRNRHLRARCFCIPHGPTADSSPMIRAGHGLIRRRRIHAHAEIPAARKAHACRRRRRRSTGPRTPGRCSAPSALALLPPTAHPRGMMKPDEHRRALPLMKATTPLCAGPLAPQPTGWSHQGHAPHASSMSSRSSTLTC